MSDNEYNGGSPIDRSKRPRFQDEELDSDYERDGHDDRHPKRVAVADPETKAPHHFVPSGQEEGASSKSTRRNKWEEKGGDSEEENEEVDDLVKESSVKSNKEDQEEQKDKIVMAPGENISIRSLVGTKDAGVIIGRGGKNVSDIRELSSARVTISEIVPGAYERILTVTGPVNAVAKAYSLVGEKILSEHTQPEESNADGEQTLTIKLLVPDSKMGTLIGKGGSVIKSIQDESGSRLNASEEPLPLSTERTISVQGTPLAVQHAIQRIGKILMDHPDRASPNHIQYRPTANHHHVISTNNSRHGGGGGGGHNQGGGYMNMRGGNGNNAAMTAAMMGYGGMMPMPMNNPAAAAAAAAAAASQFYYQQGNPMTASTIASGNAVGYPNSSSSSRHNDYQMSSMAAASMGGMGPMAGMSGMVASSQAQQIFIPNEMVGCIIGKGGSKINEIRQLSNSHIKIADSHGDANERLVTITGTPESNQIALYLLYSRLELEKNRLGMRQQ